MDDVYERFCELLKTHNVKAIDVSRATGISSTVFSEWKKGKARPKIDKLQKIADYFNISVDYLITGKISENSLTDKIDLSKLDDMTITMIEKYQKLSPENQILFVEMLEAHLNKHPSQP